MDAAASRPKTAPLIANAILDRTGSGTGIAWYVVGSCVVAFVALLLLPRGAVAPVVEGAEAVRPAGTAV
jgi:hypothetical protein